MTTLEVLRKLETETKAAVFIVGGFPRDFGRNKKNADLDIVVRGLPIEEVIGFLNKYGKTKPVTLSKTNEDFVVGITLFKASNDEVEAQVSLPKRGINQIPDESNSLKQDARFRDLTINSLYLPIFFKNKKDILDPLEVGKKDIKERVLRTYEDPMVLFRMSPERILRVISMAARTDYTIDKSLMEALSSDEVKDLVKKVPIDSVRKMLNHVLLSARPSKYFKFMHKIGLLGIVLPELDNCYGVLQDKKYHKYDVFHHCVYTCDKIKPNLVLRLAAVLHDIGKPATREFHKASGRTTFHKHEMVGLKICKECLRRLGYDNSTIKSVCSLVKHHMYHYTSDFTDGAVRRFIARVGITERDLDNLPEFPLFQLRSAERLGNGLKGTARTARQEDFEEQIKRVFKESSGFSVKDLSVSGNTVMEYLGIGPSPLVGQILTYLLNIVLDNPKANTKETLLEKALEYFRRAV